MKSVRFSLILAALLFLSIVFDDRVPDAHAQSHASDLAKIKVGDVAPDFTLEDQNGRAVTLASFREKKHVVLVFYRGHW